MDGDRGADRAFVEELTLDPECHVLVRHKRQAEDAAQVLVFMEIRGTEVVGPFPSIRETAGPP
jgi:hypothetical protein